MSRPGPGAGKLVVRAEKAKSSAIGFAQGFLSLFRGLRFVYVDHRELARFYLPPMFLAIIFLIAGWVVFAMNADDIVRALWPEPGPDVLWGLARAVWRAAAVALWVILALATAVIAMVLFSVFAAPFSDLISERVEGILGTWTPRPFSLKFMIADLGQTVRFEAIRAGIKIAWLAPLFVLSMLIPVAGQAFYVVFGGYLLSKYLGMDYVDWCAARRGWTWKRRFEFAKKHRFAFSGLGTAVILSLMVPLAFVLVWPAAVAAGAILFTSIHKEDS
jgi:CysZ protein